MKFHAALLALLLVTNAWPQAIPDYYTRSNFLSAPPAAFEHGLLGFTNPANLAFLPKPELRFFWGTDGDDAVSLENWGAFSGIPHLGFSVQRQKFGGVGVTDFKLSAALGSPAFALGLGYGWSNGKQDALGREKLFTVGTILRSSRFLSLGLAGNFSVESSNREGVAEIGFRPFGTPRLMLFADAALRKGVDVSDAPYSLGGALKIVPGVHLLARYFDSDTFTLGLTVNFGRSGTGAQTHFDENSNHAFNSYHFRLGGAEPSFLPVLLSREKRYVPLALKGTVDHLRYQYLDAGTLRLMDILKDIRAAVEDPRVSALAVNLSGLRIRAEHAWEIREELKRARAAGKQVLIFIDRVQMTGYHLASVADRVALDPQGSIMLQGYALNRTYFKGTLEKLGLGFQELRFFKYKSFAEALSRESMSEAEREQRQAYVDDWYELTRADVCAGRSLTPAHFDSLVDSQTYITAPQALKAGLVDTLARWSDIGGVVQNLTGRPKSGIAPGRLFANALPAEQWGERPKIAVVYALGVCALDEGIKARWLEGVLLALARSQSVKAIVLRVDSPGGDGMASDLVAEALKKCSDSKPVIISQGQVAASGGYWISMYGDEIVAGPNTVTGSIGVIAGWVYDKGFGRKLGMTSDLVKRGEHADLGKGVRIPFIPWQVPARNLTEEEIEKAELAIRFHYDDFVKKVAQGRNMPEARVRDLAEGRIYSGIAAKALGLVDEIGGLTTAIEIAKRKSGMKTGTDFDIIEIPNTKGFINLRKQFSPVAASVSSDPTVQFIKFMLDMNGTPAPVLTPGTYPELD